MATGGIHGVVRHVHRIAFLQGAADIPDAQLLRRFADHRNEAAFEAILRRHGPTVLGVCRRVLRNYHDAEDAFQAAFVIFVRKAASIRQGASLAGWLHRTAFRAALEVQKMRRRSREKQVSGMPEPAVAAAEPMASDARRVLDRELDRLPAKYRDAVVRCDLEGKTRAEVARQLGLPEGTVSGRLTTARRMLARRLARHGLTCSGVALAALLAESGASARVPEPLAASTTSIASRLLAGAAIVGEAAAIANGVLKTMFIEKLRIGSALLALATLTACGVGYLYTRTAAAAPPVLQAGGTRVFGEFIGSSPCDDAIRPLLDIPATADAHMMQWKLTLRQDSDTLAPAGYELVCKHGVTSANKPGLDPEAKTVERKGRWSVSKGTKSHPDAVVYELHGAVSLVKVDPNVLHVLDRDRRLLVGGAGWSYTLYRTDAAEKRVDPSLYARKPPESYTLLPVATGPSVFGVFGGRSPAQRIGQELKMTEFETCPRIKWRLTLFQAAGTHAPTTYRMEHSLRPKEVREGKATAVPREGNWTVIRGTASDPTAVVYRLDATKDEPALFLLRGDDNVLFFLDQGGRPLVGNADFSYTLNRKVDPKPPSSKSKSEE
jgi:RNA polymerase sigma factor (sigma-70 family)